MRKKITWVLALILVPACILMLSSTLSNLRESHWQLYYELYQLKQSVKHKVFPPTEWEVLTAGVTNHSDIQKSKPGSLWVDSKQPVFKQLLAKDQYDVLILPFQKLPVWLQSERSMPVDSVSRMLMARLLSASLESKHDVRIPNPDLVGGALGGMGYEYGQKDVFELAEQLQVKTLVQGYIYSKGADLELLIKVNKVNKKGEFVQDSYSDRVWSGITRDHIDLPFESFNKKLPEIVEFLELGPGTQGIDKVDGSYQVATPESLDEIVDSRNSVPLALYHLQYLGMLYPVLESREKERLFERSLAGLANLSERSPVYRLLKARALFYLHRRPAALAALGEADTPSEKAFRAFLDGNLPELESGIQEIESPLEKLMAQIEFYKLRLSYEHSLGRDEVTELAGQSPFWKELIVRTIFEDDLWHSGSALELKQKLDEQFPFSDSSADSLLKARIATMEPMPNEIEWGVLVSEHTRRVIEDKTYSPEFKSNNSWSYNLFDYLNIFNVSAEFNLVKQAQFYLTAQGLPRKTMEIFEKSKDHYPEHPELALFNAKAIHKTALNQPEPMRANLRGKAITSLSEMGKWFSGETTYSEMFTDTVDEIYKIAMADRKLAGRLLNTESRKPSFPQRYFANANFHEGLLYTHNKPYYLYRVAFESAVKRDKDGVLQVIEDNKHRFVGNPQKNNYLASIWKRMDDKEEMEKLYRHAITKNTYDFEPYNEIGRSYLMQSDYQSAFDVYEKYPAFADPKNVHRVSLANYSASFGFNLFWRGQHELARPFFEKSIGYGGGSDGHLHSQIQLYVLDKKFIHAAQGSLSRANRYRSSYAYRDYMNLLHVLGYGEPAWSAFSELVTKMSQPHLWTSAVIGHRIEGMQYKEIKKWLAGFKNIAVDHNAGMNPKVRYLILTSLVDRKPDKNLLDYINSFGMEKIVADTLSVFISAYHALLQHDNEAAMQHFGSLSDEQQIRFKPTVSGSNRTLVFSYFIRALSVTGETEKARERLLEFKKLYSSYKTYKYKYVWFDFHLASAYIAAAENKHEMALEELKKAFNMMPFTEDRILFTWYEVLEACEWLYIETDDVRYKDLMLEWAQQWQEIQPAYSWAYAFEAKYTDLPERRRRALAYTLYLDKNSWRISEFSKTERENAKKWLNKNNQFKLSEQNLPKHGA